MYKISLINMPFASLSLPSIALTQLKAVTEQQRGDQVRTRLLYLNQELSQFFGAALYGYVTRALQANNSGLGDWIFRQAAFPDLEDNSVYYFQRYFPHLDGTEEAFKGALLAKRAVLVRYLDRLVARYQLAEEDLVGFTSMFAQNLACFAMARAIKARNPQVTTVIGGANCEAPMGRELARHVAAVDFVFSGPALVSFPELVRCRIAGDGDQERRIRGVFCRHNLDSPHLVGHGALGEELPIEVPVPLDYESFLADLGRNFPDGSVQPSLTFETSRGCWWGERSHCTFCGLNGSTMMYRAMPPPQAVALFAELFDKWRGRCSRFESVDNILPRQYLKEVFPHLSPPPGTVIFYEVKADFKDWEMEILSRAGVTEIQPGIEALASSTLKLMGKGTTAAQNVNFLKNCLRYGISPVWNLLIGFPREDAQVYAKYLRDMPLLVHLPPPSGAFPVRFDRYSPYFTRARDYGLDLAPYEFYHAIYPFDAESIGNTAYYFEDRNYGAEYLVNLLDWQARLTTAVAAWQRRFSGEDGRPRAELHLAARAGELAVRDSRSGDVVEHPLSELGVGLLYAARARGLALSSLAEQAGADETAAAAELAELTARGLLFAENERYISLVLGLEQWPLTQAAARPVAAVAGTLAAAGGARVDG
jgi:ribosomal peptide maturation radical SAM protein 1